MSSIKINYSPVSEVNLVNDSINIRNYEFRNFNDEPYLIIDNDKLILIETWNERCIPCIKAINNLESTIDKYKDVEHFYVYIGQKDPLIDLNNYIKDSSKLLLDTKDIIKTEIGFSSYPVFLLFDKQGNYINHIKGYTTKAEMTIKIENLLNPY